MAYGFVDLAVWHHLPLLIRSVIDLSLVEHQLATFCHKLKLVSIVA